MLCHPTRRVPFKEFICQYCGDEHLTTHHVTRTQPQLLHYPSTYSIQPVSLHDLTDAPLGPMPCACINKPVWYSGDKCGKCEDVSISCVVYVSRLLILLLQYAPRPVQTTTELVCLSVSKGSPSYARRYLHPKYTGRLISWDIGGPSSSIMGRQPVRRNATHDNNCNMNNESSLSVESAFKSKHLQYVHTNTAKDLTMVPVMT